MSSTAAPNPSKHTKPPQPSSPSQSRKRKAPPSSTPLSSSTSQPPPTHPSSQRRPPKRNKFHDARAILTQTSDAAFLSNESTTGLSSTIDAGALDLNAFLQAREFEIKALEDGLRRSKAAGMARAFQQVPRDMRRRTASHNSKRVPKRLRPRAEREMKEDNTPTGKAERNKGKGKGKAGAQTTRARLRSETAKRLEGLATRKREKKEQKQMSRQELGEELGQGTGGGKMAETENREKSGIVTRRPLPKARMNTINVPLVPKSKFRERQIHKTWLPTHLWHAKRARMTEPKHPYWRMAIPITPTEKSYRPTHRAGSVRGTVCWDKSYMSTIGLNGTALAIEKVLGGLGVSDDASWDNHTAGVRWRAGKRSWSGWLSREEEATRRMIAPATIIWCTSIHESAPPVEMEGIDHHNDSNGKPKVKPKKHQIMIRIHPAAFLELWIELLVLAKKQRPPVHIEDLRFQIGSVDIIGPASTEALLSILHPFDETDAHSAMFLSLAGLTNPAALPPNALLSFDIEDPRLRYPPRKLTITQDEQSDFALLEKISKWSIDAQSSRANFFDRTARHNASALPSQKALNRRKALASRGTYPARTPSDPRIPIMLLASRRSGSSNEQGTWTLLAPWSCILPIWYGLVHCPLNTGGNPRFGGLQETQQIDFEHRQPWFPGDCVGTHAGWMWELQERVRRKNEWKGRPKGRRVEYESISLGSGRKGEIGRGWACDFERLLGIEAQEATSPVHHDDELEVDGVIKDVPLVSQQAVPLPTVPIQQVGRTTFLSLLKGTGGDVPPNAVANVRISLLTKGVPQSCARVYRLPSPLPSAVVDDVPTAEGEQGNETPAAGEENTETTQPSKHARPAQRQQGKQVQSRQPTALCPRAQWFALVPAKHPLTATPSTSRERSSKRSTSTIDGKADPQAHQRALVADLLRTPALPYPAPPRVEDLHPPIPTEEDLIGFVTTGSFNLAHGMGSAMATVLVSRVVGNGRRTEEENVRERRMCIVRNAGETVGRLGIWEAV